MFRFKGHEDLKMDLEMEPTKNPKEAWVQNTRRRPDGPQEETSTKGLPSQKKEARRSVDVQQQHL